MIILVALLAQAPVFADDFEADALPAGWKGRDATLTLERTIVKSGKASLRCDLLKPAAAIHSPAVPDDWSTVARISFWIRSEDAAVLQVDVQERSTKAHFFRKVALKAGEWTPVDLALWQFRAESAPSWKRISQLSLWVREGKGPVFVDDFKLPAHAMRVAVGKIADPPTVEPEESVLARAFGEEAKSAARARTANFRVYSNAHAKLDGYAASLEEHLKTARRALGLGEGFLDAPVTLALFRDREQYGAFMRRTAREVHDVETKETDFRGEGGTYQEYSGAVCEPEGALRGPAFQSVTRQIVARLLRMRAPKSTWAEDGLIVFLRHESAPIKELPAAVRAMIADAKRPSLATFDGSTTNRDVQAMTVIAFLAKGPHRDRLSAVLDALRDDPKLVSAVSVALNRGIGDFEAEWEKFCRESWK